MLPRHASAVRTARIALALATSARTVRTAKIARIAIAQTARKLSNQAFLG